ncbi:MAG TPA: SCO family protein [Candidatus Binatia bacterium]
MNLRSKISSAVTLATLLVSGSQTTARAHFPIPPKQPSEIGRRVVKKPVPDFTLMDQDGKSFRFAASHGKVVLITFIFTTCPDVCPLLTAKFAAIQRALAEQKIADYQLLSITTDPERDSTAALKEYAGRFKADLTHWSFVTGTRADLAKVWKAMGVNVTKTDAGEVSHTTLTMLVDRRGTRRVDYYGDKWLDKEVLNDFQRLSAQK